MPAIFNRALIKGTILLAASLPVGLAFAQNGSARPETSGLVGSRSYGLSGLKDFSLIIDQSDRTNVVGGEILSGSYSSPWFTRGVDGLHLASMSRHPDPWRHIKPATMLRLNTPVFLAVQPLRVDAQFFVGPAPKGVNLEIIRLKKDRHKAPLTLFVEGDTVNARVCRDDRSCFSQVAGTLSAQRSAHVVFDANPGDMLELTVNGTHSHVPLSTAVTHQKLVFEFGIGSDNDVYALPTPERAVISTLSIQL